MLGFDQRPNDRRKIDGIIRRLAKERAELDKLQDKYPSTYIGRDLEQYAFCTKKTLEEGTDNRFEDYGTLNKANRDEARISIRSR